MGLRSAACFPFRFGKAPLSVQGATGADASHAFMLAFLNDTPVSAMMIPVVASCSR